jgi:hypothetical protein
VEPKIDLGVAAGHKRRGHAVWATPEVPKCAATVARDERSYGAVFGAGVGAPIADSRAGRTEVSTLPRRAHIATYEHGLLSAGRPIGHELLHDPEMVLGVPSQGRVLELRPAPCRRLHARQRPTYLQ